jgi:hypothetical protein
MDRNSMNIEQRINELEQRSLAYLEQPDSVHENMTYQFTVSDEYQVRVESDARNDEARKFGDKIVMPALQTSIFIGHRGGLAERRQRNAMAFSCLYGHDPEPQLHGIQYDAPHELPAPVTIADLLADPRIDVRNHIGMIALSEEERMLYEATLAIARLADSHNPNAIKYTHPPIDNVAVAQCTEAEGEAYDAWCDAHTYNLKGVTASGTTVQTFLHAAALVLAKGTFYKQRSLLREVPVSHESRTVYLEANDKHETEGRRYGRGADDPLLKIAITEDGIEHIYERTAMGQAEIRLHNGNDIEKYRGLSSFIGNYDSDGTLVSFSFSQQEFDEIIALERMAGLLEPTPTRLDFFLSRIVSLPDL